MSIIGLEGLSDAQFEMELRQGGKFIVFQYCISILLITFRRSSDVHFIKNNESPFMVGFPYTLLSLFFGWWGIPWGPIYTIGAIAENIKGGKDVTGEIMKAINK